jgi:ankyrin repeat protein
MPLFNEEKLIESIVVPDLSKFNLSPEESDLLKNAIIKIKHDQLIALASNHIIPLLDLIDLSDKALLKLAVMDNDIDFNELVELYNIKLDDHKQKKVDEQLRRAVTQLEKPDEYETIFKFRHLYFLDKRDSGFRQNEQAFPESISERLLTTDHRPYIAYYLRKPSANLSQEEFKILKKVYPEEQLKSKMIRREAHKDIGLTIIEIQCLIVGIVNSIEEGSIPKENLAPAELSPTQLKHYQIYTNKMSFNLVSKGQLDELKAMIRNDSSWMTACQDYHSKMTPLLWAVKHDQVQVVEFLLANNADIDHADHNDYTAFHYAVEKNSSVILEMLLTRKGDVNAQDRGNYTPIYIAAELGHVDQVKLLLDHGADPDLANNRYGSTALHIAVRNRQMAVVKILLASKKTSASSKDKDGLTPLDLAKNNTAIYALIASHFNNLALRNANSSTIPLNAATFQSSLASQPATHLMMPVNSLALRNANSSTIPLNAATFQSSLASHPAAHLMMPVNSLALRNANSSTIPLNAATFQSSLASQPAAHLMMPVNSLALRNANSSTVPLNAATFQSSLASHPAAHLMPFNSLAWPNPSTTVVPKVALPKQTIDWLAGALEKPKENYAALTQQLPFYEKGINPFSENFSVTSKSEVNDFNPLANYSAAIRSEATLISKTKTKLQEIAHSLQEMEGSKLTFPQCYRKIINLIARAQEEGISLLAVAFEIYRLHYLQALVELQDQKSPMQVAIESEDINAINEILLEEPKRESYTIHYKNNGYSEIEFAIILGKVTVVQTFLEAKERDKAINLGEFQDEPLKRSQERYDDLTNTNPAFREAEEYYDIDIPLASRMNIIRLLKNLIKTLPTGTETVNGLFRPEEYTIIQVLNAEKEKALIGRYRWMNAIRHLKRNGMGESCSKKNPANQSILQIADSVPRAKSVFKHATANYEKIKKSNQLETVQTVLSTRKVSAVSTPIGSRSNIFFSQNSPATAITPLRGKTSHIIELDIVRAIQDKLLSSKDIYTSPHLSAFKINRSEVPIIFIGEDLSKKTIYRVYHLTKKDPVTNKESFHKCHIFDYYENNRLVLSDNKEYLMEQEFFCGDNVKITSYRLIDFLRKIKGPFVEGSYYHYVLANAMNLTVLDAARAAIFNVLNTEGKITKNIRLDHPAITITNNLTAAHYEPLCSDVIQTINNFVENNELLKLQETINDYSIYKEQLSFALEKAIECQLAAIVNYLLDFGVPISAFNNNALLNKAITALEKSYIKYNKNIEQAEVKKAIEILSLILYQGSADSEDPKHIRYAASTDSFSDSKTIWADTTHDIKSLIRLIIFFVDSNDLCNFLLVNTASKQLTLLYNFTASLTLIELHEQIAKRLNQPSYFSRPRFKNLVAIENNDVNSLQQCLDAEIGDQESYRWLYLVSLFYAIRLEKNDIIRTLYPKRGQLITFDLHPLLFAIRIGRVSTVKLLLELGANLDEKNIFKDTAIEFAKYLNAVELLPFLYYKSKAYGLKQALLAAIEHKQINSFQLILDEQKSKLVKLFPSQELTEIMSAAVETNDKEIVELILPDYLESTVNDYFRTSKYTKIFNLAIEKNLLTSLDLLYVTVSKQESIDIEYVLRDSIYKAAETGSTEALEMINGYITRLPAAVNSKVLKSVNGPHENLLHAALFSANFDNLYFIKKTMPKLTYFCKAFPSPMALFKKAMFYNKKEIVEKLIEEGISFPQTEDEKINLLTNCVLNGSTNIIQWFFNKQLNSEYVFGSNKQNCLQAIFQNFVHDEILHNRVEGKSQLPSPYDKNIERSIQYLAGAMNIPVNYKDAQGKAILFYNPMYNLYALEIIKVVLKLEQTDLTVKDQENNTILHSLPISFITSDLLDRYVNQGGNINDENNINKTPFTNYLLSEYTKSEERIKSKKAKRKSADFSFLSKASDGATAKFIQLGARAASHVQADFHSLGIVTCANNKELYLLTHGKNIPLYELNEYYSERAIYFRPKIASGNSVLKLHWYKSRNGGFPDIERIISYINYNEHSWVKYPNQSLNDGKLVSNGIQTFAVGPAMKIILEKVYDHFQQKQLQGKCDEFILSDDEYELVTKGILKALKTSNAAYGGVLNKSLGESPEALNEYKSLEIEVPCTTFHLIKWLDNLPCYSKEVVDSPLTLSIYLGQIDIAKYLVNNGILYNLLNSHYTKLLLLAIEHQDSSFFKLLLHTTLMQGLFSSQTKIARSYFNYLAVYIICDMDDKNILQVAQKQLIAILINSIKDLKKSDINKFKESLYKQVAKCQKKSPEINLDSVKKLFNESIVNQIVMTNDNVDIVNEPPNKRLKINNDKEESGESSDRKGKSKRQNSNEDEDEDEDARSHKRKRLIASESDSDTEEDKQSSSLQAQTARTPIPSPSIPGTLFYQSPVQNATKSEFKSKLLSINFKTLTK